MDFEILFCIKSGHSVTFHVILLIQNMREKKLQGSLYFIFLTFKMCPVIGRKLSWFYDL